MVDFSPAWVGDGLPGRPDRNTNPYDSATNSYDRTKSNDRLVSAYRYPKPGFDSDIGNPPGNQEK